MFYCFIVLENFNIFRTWRIWGVYQAMQLEAEAHHSKILDGPFREQWLAVPNVAHIPDAEDMNNRLPTYILIYVYIYIYLYICIYLYIYILFIHLIIYLLKDLLIYFYIYLCIYTNIYIYKYIYTHKTTNTHELVPLKRHEFVMAASVTQRNRHAFAPRKRDAEDMNNRLPVYILIYVYIYIYMYIFIYVFLYI